MTHYPDWLDMDQLNARARELTGIARVHGEDVAQAVAQGTSLPDSLMTGGLYTAPSCPPDQDQR